MCFLKLTLKQRCSKFLLNALSLGGSPGFHEAIGNTIQLLTSGLNHLIGEGLVDEPADRHQLLINQLMSLALIDIPISLFSYTIDKWIFDFYTGKISDDELNKHWWDLRQNYQVSNLTSDIIL